MILAEDETDLLLFPPLRASWSPRGHPQEVVLSGRNAKWVLFGSINIRTGHRLSLVRFKQRADDFRAFLELLHRHYWAWQVVLLLDGDSSHTAQASRKIANQHQIELIWLPKRSPHLNPMDHLWRHSRGVLANRQHASIEELVEQTLNDLHGLPPQDALSKSRAAIRRFLASQPVM